MNTELKKAKNDSEKDFFKLINNTVFEKTLKNGRKHGGIKLVTTEARRNYLVSEPNYHAIFFFRIFVSNTNGKKTDVHKPVYLGLSILEISKIVMYEFWYDHIKSEHGEKAKSCYMDTDCCIIYIKTR